MKILIVNGSPAGDESITLQTLLYIQKHFPGHDWTQLNVIQQLHALERDFAPAAEALREAELIMFSYPVYTFLAPAQLHRFLELLKAGGTDVSGKWAAQVSTSKHFYDTTAHAFLRENCADLGLRYIGGLSADMEDLLGDKGQAEALAFFRHVLWAVENDRYDRAAVPVPAGALHTAAVPEPVEKAAPFTVALVADIGPEDARLAAMADRFEAVAPFAVKRVDLRDFRFAGGCLGCFRCAADGQCFYTDGFDRLLREEIQTADATVCAFAVRDHSMGSRFKFYDDRQFCNGHRTVTMGKPVGYLVDGFLSVEPNLRTLIEARAQVGGNHLSGVAVSESDVNAAVDALAAELRYDLENGFRQPADFYGVGGMKIFRDLIFTMQGLMRADHRFYKAHGFYKDFPQRHRGKIAAMYLVGALMTSPKLKRRLGSKMTEGMLAPYKKVLEKK